MGTRTITTTGTLVAIRIDPGALVGGTPRMMIEGIVQDEAGNVVQSVAEDVYPLLTAAMKTSVQALIARAATRVAAAAGD